MGLPAGLLDAGYTRLLRPVLFRAYDGDPEAIHERTIRLLAGVGSEALARALTGLVAGSSGRRTTVAGIDFPSRVGLAAGLDKDATAVLAWQGLGFGFAELGTVTGRAQPGNPKPRMFRLRDSKALVNRMGFNNPGAEAVAATLAARNVYRGNAAAGIPIGISIGKTKLVALEDAVADYLLSFRLLAPHADYVAVNVSSPNTPGLRALQDGGALADLVGALRTEAEALAAGGRPVPIFVKVAPDLTWAQLDEVLATCADHGAAGLVATNTTLARDGLAASDQGRAGEAGGLSGAPLTRRAREVVAYVCAHTRLPVIGSGGVMTAADAVALFDAGASLVQLYTGFIYGGPGLPAAVNALDGERKGS
ncbi:MAG: quinone-dependent dihydroorotate dehydrogenase [Propionicimonas sp.]|uniref:quinone-dependent dihydroorotate dehydrogenase n=1 Tax=Propionicimonas sp. TaxID=1955623 RepID=UPI003D0B9079